MVRYSISKVNNFPVFVEDAEDTWALTRFTLADQIVLQGSTTFDNVHIDTVGGAPKTTGTIGPTTVTGDKTYGFYKIYILGRGDFSDCTLDINRTIQTGSEELGEWFSIDEVDFTYEITLSGAGLTAYEVVIVGFRYGDGTMQYLSIS